MTDINDLLNFAGAEQPTRFASAFDEIMGQKIINSLDDRRISVAQSMFASSEEDPEDDEDLDADELEDIDFEDDEDLDDLDLDDEDLELDDEDLEGWEEDDEDA